jgi:hypothetical protein
MLVLGIESDFWLFEFEYGCWNMYALGVVISKHVAWVLIAKCIGYLDSILSSCFDV